MRWKVAKLILVLLPLLGLAALSCTSTPSDVIPDLAYVRCMWGTFTNDADPQPDGISIDVRFYDTKSEQIAFRDVPCKVRFKLYAYPVEQGDERPAWNAERQLIYEGEFTKDYSYGMGFAIVEEPYEILYDDLPLGNWDPRWIFVDEDEVTVETPKQGVFTCSD